MIEQKLAEIEARLARVTPDDNAEFIAHSKQDIAELIQIIRGLMGTIQGLVADRPPAPIVFQVTGEQMESIKAVWKGETIE